MKVKSPRNWTKLMQDELDHAQLVEEYFPNPINQYYKQWLRTARENYGIGKSTTKDVYHAMLSYEVERHKNGRLQKLINKIKQSWR